MKPALALSLALSVALGGCGTARYATFVTKTSLSLVDTDTTPVEASIGFNRVEGYVGPRFEDGSVYPVVGFIDAHGSFLQREAIQVFAGGPAAVKVVGGTPATPPASAKCSDDRVAPPMYFATSTSMGLRAGFAEGTAVPLSFNLGYRRKEMSVVPVSQNCQPSILATHDSDAGARKKVGDPKLDFGVVQYFATGAAAEALADQARTKALFAKGLERAASAPAP